MLNRLLPTIAFIFLTSVLSVAHAVTFTGHALIDFPTGACITDPTPLDANGQDVVFFVNGAFRVSGFDMTKLCILYETGSDNLQIATYTHNNTSNTDIITGDADGNGDGGTVSSDLIGSGVQDIANFGAPEFFSLLLDFDFTVNNGFSIVAGKASNKALTDFGVFIAGSSSLNDSNSSVMFGATEGAAIGSSTSTPSSTAPHLEFTIAHFKSIPGLALDWTDPNDAIALHFTMGNAAATPIPSETFPSKIDPRFYYGFYPLTVAHLLQIDADGDGIIDDLDTDDDADGISDLIEMGIKSCDLNGDGVLSVSQDTNFNGKFDAGEAGEILKCKAGGFDATGVDIVRKSAFPGGKYPDYDGDGIPNYLDTDSDNDGVPDKDEDKNGNGIVDKGETDPLNPDTNGNGISDLDELNKFKIDTDGDGLSDGDEIENYGTDPNKPDTDNDGLSDGDEVKLHGTDPLNPDTDGGGARDGLEVQRKTNPLNPGDDHFALELPQTAIGPGEVDAGTIDPNLAGYSTNEVHLSGSGLTSCSLTTSADATTAPSILIIFGVMLLIPLAMRARFRVHRFIFAFFFLLLFSSPAKALDVQLQRLPMNGYGGLFMDNTQMLGHMHWNVAIGLDYTQRPLQMSLISSGARLDNVVDYFVTQDTNIAFGITDWLDISLAFQINTPSKVEPVGATAPTTEVNFGDILLSTKFLLLDPVEERYGLGLVVIPFVTFPTGDDGRYFGSSGMTGGFKVVGEKYFGRTDVYVMLGALFKSTENLQINLDVGSNMLFAFGAQHPISTKHDFIILGEFSGSTTFDKFMHQENTSPVEMNGGLRKYWFDRRLAATASVGTGIDSGYGAPRIRTMANLSFFSHPVNDRDDDTVKDPGDYCPTRFMVLDNPGLRPGCPDTSTIVKVVGDRIIIFRPINFETGSAVITDDSMTVIDQIATLMQKTPELKKVLVEGHTDSVGGEKFNQALSESRAKAVVTALVSRGISPNRLTSRGWGLSKPLTSNDSDAGRAQNRRVEFHILEIKS